MLNSYQTFSKRMLFGDDEKHNVIEEQKPVPHSFQPMFGEFQLMGDSLLLRFADQILQHPHIIIHSTGNIGYCVNGQRIEQLQQRVKLKLHPLSSKVMLLIGTNDVLCGGNIYNMVKHFNALLNVLEKSVEKLLILTLPPIPKLCVTYYHWTLIRLYNEYLKTLDNGRSVIVADICPLFTKFKSALEYEVELPPVNYETDFKGPPLRRIKFIEDGQIDQFYSFKKRKSLWSRKKCFSDRSSPNRRHADKSESDYRNSTDTNTSIDSEILSSELSQEKENCPSFTVYQDISDSYEKHIQPSLKPPGKVLPSCELFIRTFESVFGKQSLRRKKIAVGGVKIRTSSIEQPEKRPRKSPCDLNENLDGIDNWKIDSDEDSMSELVYRSQEEINYEVVDVSSNRKKKKSNEFFKFLESTNESDETPKKSHRKWKRGSFRNEKPEDPSSSSSSCEESPRKQIHPFIDYNFKGFYEKCCSLLGEIECMTDEETVFHHPQNQCHNTGSYQTVVNDMLNQGDCYGKLFLSSHGFRNIDGISDKYKMILKLANQICHLEYYEIFHSFSNRRIDMIHLNYPGLMQLKNFLISNEYVTL